MPRIRSPVPPATTAFGSRGRRSGERSRIGSTPVKRAFFVKCDEETNPRSEIAQGRVWCEIGVNPPFPAEFVIFRVGVWDGGSSVAEEILNR